MTDVQGLTRLTVNLTPRSVRAIDSASEIVTENKTGVVNRAVQMYAYLCEHLGGDALVYTAALVECWQEKNGIEEGRRD